MPYNRIPPNTLIEIDGVDHVHRGHVLGRHHMVDAVTGADFRTKGADGVPVLPDDEQFSEMLGDERLVVRTVSATDRVRMLNSVAQWTLKDAVALDAFAGKRLAICNMLDDDGVPNGEKATDRWIAANWSDALRAEHGDAPPTRTIRSWRSKRGTLGRRHARDMVSMAGKVPRAPYCIDVVQETIQKHALNAVVNDATVRSGYSLFVAEMKSINEGRHPVHHKPSEPYVIPSKRTFRRRRDALEQSMTVKAGKGRMGFEQGWEGGGRCLTADFALHRVIIDHTPLNVHAVSDDLEMVLGRPWLTLAIDVFSRAVVAWVLTFMDPCGWTVGETLRRLALPKRYNADLLRRYPILRDIRGKPTEIVLDNAAEFRSHDLEAALRAQGVGVRWCPIRKPRYRAVGERAIHTVNEWTCCDMPGRVLPPAETKRLGYDPADTACMLLDEIEACLATVIGEYNVEPHGGLQDRQPALIFEREANREGIAVWADLDALRLDTLPVEPDVQLSPSGIKAFGTLRYAGKREVAELLDDLVAIEGRRQRRDQATATVSYRYDPLDISKIHVWNRRRRIYVTLECTDRSYADGMPLAFHEQLRAEARRQSLAFNTEEEREAFRGERIRAIREIDPAERARARKDVALLYETPRLRQITGRIVDLHAEAPSAIDIGDYIPHERAALTAFDVEVLMPRKAPKPRAKTSLDARRDRRDAGAPLTPDEADRNPVAAPAPRRRRGGEDYQ